jgi:uncharacterized RDD family membrane protein YckC
MRITRLHAALACLLLAGGITVSAQVRPEPGRPDVLPQGMTPQSDPPLEQPTGEMREDIRRVRIRPIFRGAQDYTLAAGDAVRDVRSVFGDVTIEGRVEQDVVVFLGSARVAGTGLIGGSLVVLGGSATIDPGAAIHRDLVVIGGTVTSPPGFSPSGDHVVIGSPWMGNTLQNGLPWVTRGLLWGRLIVPDLAWIWVVVGIFFLVYLALNAVFDRPVSASADVLIERPLSVFVTGLLVLILIVPVLAIMAATVIGLAVVPFLLCAIVVAGLVGKTAVARAMGRSVLRSESPESRLAAFAAFTLGFVLLALAYMVPVLGFVTWALTSVLGLGAATVTFRSYLRRERRAAAPAAAPAGVAPVSAPIGADMPGASAPANFSPEEIPPVPLEPPPPPFFNQGLAQYPRAAFLDRVAAFALDCVLVAIANALFDMNRNDGFFFFLLLAYHIAFWAWKGTTLGGIICNLRVVRTHGTDLRFVDALVRGLSSVFSIAALGIGCLWMLQDPERQMWHDKIAGTLVVKVPRHVVLP